MDLNTEALEAELKEQKQKLRETIGELGDAARSSVNLRTQLDDHPILLLSAAAAVGVAAGVLSGSRERREARRFAAYDRFYAKGERILKNTSPAFRQKRRVNPMLKQVLLVLASRFAQVAEDAVRERMSRRRSPRNRPR